MTPKGLSSILIGSLVILGMVIGFWEKSIFWGYETHGAVQSACTHFMTPRPENGRNFFW